MFKFNFNFNKGPELISGILAGFMMAGLVHVLILIFFDLLDYKVIRTENSTFFNFPVEAQVISVIASVIAFIFTFHSIYFSGYRKDSLFIKVLKFIKKSFNVN